MEWTYLPYGLHECAKDKEVGRKGLSAFAEGEIGRRIR